jgi:hypothetical protein
LSKYSGRPNLQPTDLGFAKVGDLETVKPELLLGFVLLLMFTYFCLALFVKPELKLNDLLLLMLTTSSPTFAKPYVGRLCFFLVNPYLAVLVKRGACDVVNSFCVTLLVL